jgi:hypothetical protein
VDSVTVLRERYSALNQQRVRAADDFSRRAQLYACLDQSLAQRTRFFGAAALTNSVLAVLFSRGTLLLTVSSATGEFLRRLGSSLEDFNLERVRLLEGAVSSGESLDVAMVQSEQAQVQDRLTRLKLYSTSVHGAVITELDRILNSCRWLATCGSRCAGVAAYRSALPRVRAELGCAIHFEDRFHRECIGGTLIGQLRGAAVLAT